MGADDLNAAVTYARTQQLLVNRLLGGWGILGGMRLSAPEGAVALNRAKPLASGDITELTPNPQIVSALLGACSASSDGYARRFSRGRDRAEADRLVHW